MEQQELFDKQVPSTGEYEKEKMSVEFKAPKNITLGAYYLTRAGRVIHPMYYIALSKEPKSYEVKLQIRIGREEPFEYKHTEVESFSNLIKDSLLVKV